MARIAAPKTSGPNTPSELLAAQPSGRPDNPQCTTHRAGRSSQRKARRTAAAPRMTGGSHFTGGTVTMVYAVRQDQSVCFGRRNRTPSGYVECIDGKIPRTTRCSPSGLLQPNWPGHCRNHDLLPFQPRRSTRPRRGRSGPCRTGHSTGRRPRPPAGCLRRGMLLGLRGYVPARAGVTATAVGYTGGHTKNPTYSDVCSHTTGHAEAVLVEFDPSSVSYDKLLHTFWESHDPTTKNRQGPDIGDQYRSAIFTFSPEQESVARASVAAEQKSYAEADHDRDRAHRTNSTRPRTITSSTTRRPGATRAHFRSTRAPTATASDSQVGRPITFTLALRAT